MGKVTVKRLKANLSYDFSQGRALFAGPGGDYETINAAVDSLTWPTDLTYEKTLMDSYQAVNFGFVNGQASIDVSLVNLLTLNGNGTGKASGGNDGLAAGDLITIDDVNFYKIKSINAFDTKIYLYEKYRGTTDATNQTWKVYSLKRMTIFVLPGEHYANQDSGSIDLLPGIDLVGLGGGNIIEGNSVVGTTIFPNHPIRKFSDNNFYGLNFGPASEWQSLDQWTNGAWSEAWSGIESNIVNCSIRHGAFDNLHADGVLNIPLPLAGTLNFKNCVIDEASTSCIGLNGINTDAGSLTAAETVLNFDNCKFKTSYDNNQGFNGTDGATVSTTAGLLSISSQGETGLTDPITVNINNCMMEYFDRKIEGVAGAIKTVFGIMCTTANAVINIRNTPIRVENTDSTATMDCSAIRVSGANCNVNVYDSHLYASGTGAITINAPGAGNINLYNSTTVELGSVGAAAGNVGGSGKVFVLDWRVSIIGAITGTAANWVDNINKFVTLVAGTKQIVDTSQTTATEAIVSRVDAGGTLGHLSLDPIVPATGGVGWNVNSTSATDTSKVKIKILKP